MLTKRSSLSSRTQAHSAGDAGPIPHHLERQKWIPDRPRIKSGVVRDYKLPGRTKGPHPEPVEGRGPASRPHPQAGFSLIEVMVVLVIIGLISSVIAFNVLPALDQGKSETARIQVRTLATALTDYKFDNQTYPRTEDGLEALVRPPASLARPDRYRQGGYIRSLPSDPWGNPYQYAYPGRYGEYDIYSLGADGREGGEGQDADIGTWNLDR